jgi:hypothetical protein
MLSDITLFQTSESPATNKSGVALTAQEMDDNFVTFMRAVAALNSTGAIAAYNPATTYTSGLGAASLVRYENTTWKYIHGTPQAGVTPGTDPTAWLETSPSELAHETNKDTKLAEGTVNEVTAAQLKPLVTAGPSVTKYTTVAIGSSELLALNATPKQLVAAVVGKKLAVMKAWATTQAGTAYSDPDIQIITDTADNAQVFSSTILDTTVAKTSAFSDFPSSGNFTQLIENKALMLSAPTVDPSGGTFDIIIHIIYAELS